MENEREKRTYVRHRCEAEIECAYFNTNDFHSGKKQNFSKGGLYFISDHPFHTGSNILVKVQDLFGNGACEPNEEGFRAVTLAEVRWVHKISGTAKASYGIGARYH